METTKTFIILKKARKYFDCTVNGYKAKLVINNVSDNFEVGQEIILRVNDISERSSYGVVMKFEPIAVSGSSEDRQQLLKAEALRRAEKWLGYAESDAKSGMTRTNAIQQALSICNQHPEISERIAALEALIAENQKKYEQQKREQRQQAAKKSAEHQAAKKRRVLFPVNEKPLMNVPVRLGQRIVVFESTGTVFYINADHPSYEGSHLLGHEGERGCYCYYREATEAEISSMNQ